MVVNGYRKFVSSCNLDDCSNHAREQCCVCISDIFGHSIKKTFDIGIFSLRPDVHYPYVRWCVHFLEPKGKKRDFYVISPDLDFARREFLSVVLDLYD